MSHPIATIEKNVSVGIYDDAAYIARIYADKIIVVLPYIKWTGNSGVLAMRKESIRDPDVIAAVRAELDDDCETSAWNLIGRDLEDEYLRHR